MRSGSVCTTTEYTGSNSEAACPEPVPSVSLPIMFYESFDPRQVRLETEVLGEFSLQKKMEGSAQGRPRESVCSVYKCTSPFASPEAVLEGC